MSVLRLASTRWMSGLAALGVAASLGAAAAFADTGSPLPTRPEATSAVVDQGSIPIELPAAPALPHEGELVGGFVVELIVALILILLVVGAVLLILEVTHHHVVFHTCEECYHHAPPPPPPPPPPTPPAPQPQPEPSH